MIPVFVQNIKKSFCVNEDSLACIRDGPEVYLMKVKEQDGGRGREYVIRVNGKAPIPAYANSNLEDSSISCVYDGMKFDLPVTPIRKDLAGYLFRNDGDDLANSPYAVINRNIDTLNLPSCDSYGSL